MDVVNKNNIRRLTYSQLRLRAKERGIKANMKAEKLIAALLAGDISNQDTPLTVDKMARRKSEVSFTEKVQTPDRKEDKRNTIAKCGSRKRSRTFSLEKPVFLEEKVQTPDRKEDKRNTIAKCGSMKRSRTFSLEKPVFLELQNMGEEEKTLETPSKQENSFPVTNNSEVKISASISRKSVKRPKSKSSLHSVAFITPDTKDLHEARQSITGSPYMSVRNRPKTPAAVRTCSTKKYAGANYSPLKTPESAKRVQTRKSVVHKMTPISQNLSDEQKLMLSVAKSKRGSKEQQTQTSQTPMPSVKKSERYENNRSNTPNFALIHRRAFQKMESLDEYLENKRQRTLTLTANEAKTKIPKKKSGKKVVELSKAIKKNSPAKRQKNKSRSPAVIKSSHRILRSKVPQTFSGIPFIPSITSLKKFNFITSTEKATLLGSITKATPDTKVSQSKTCQRSLFASGYKPSVFRFGKDGASILKPVTPMVKFDNGKKENKSARKQIFDLKASLAKKLPYKPYSGALKPLSESNAQNQNEAVIHLRKKQRENLKGARKNKRFELQMRQRGISNL